MRAARLVTYCFLYYSVVLLLKDEYITRYLRDDVADLYSDEKMDELAEYYRQETRNQSSKEPFDLGNSHCAVNFYDDAILFHFTQGDELGTVITLEPEAGRNIVGFITDCPKQLHSYSPQEISEAPSWLGE